MSSKLKIFLSVLLITQALIMSAFSWTVANGDGEYRIGNIFVSISEVDGIIKCDSPVKSDFIPLELWDPAPAKCSVTNWLLVPSIALGVVGAGTLVVIQRNKRKNKKK